MGSPDRIRNTITIGSHRDELEEKRNKLHESLEKVKINGHPPILWFLRKEYIFGSNITTKKRIIYIKFSFSITNPKEYTIEFTDANGRSLRRPADQIETCYESVFEIEKYDNIHIFVELFINELLEEFIKEN